MAMINNRQDQDIKYLSGSLLLLTDNVNNLISKVNKLYGRVGSLTTTMNKRTWTIRILSLLTSRLFKDLEHSASMNEEMIQNTGKIADAFIDLANSKLPRQITDLDDLNTILKHPSEALYYFQPSYTFSFDRLEMYFRLNNVGYVIKGDQLLINLALSIRKSNLHLMTLYKVESTFVPVSFSVE